MDLSRLHELIVAAAQPGGGGGQGRTGGGEEELPLWLDILHISWRTVFLFTLVLVAIRVMGKRSVANLAPFDLAVIIIMGSVAAIPMEEHTRLIHGIVPIILMAGMQYLLAWVNLRYRPVERVTQGVSTILVKDGQILNKNMEKERVSMADLWVELRLSGISQLSEVQQATLEPNGVVSVVKTKAASPLTPEDTYALTMKRMDVLVAQNRQRLQAQFEWIMARRKRNRI